MYSQVSGDGQLNTGGERVAVHGDSDDGDDDG